MEMYLPKVSSGEKKQQTPSVRKSPFQSKFSGMLVFQIQTK